MLFEEEFQQAVGQWRLEYSEKKKRKTFTDKYLILTTVFEGMAVVSIRPY